MHHSIDLIGWIAVGSGPACFNASPLIHRHIDDNRSSSHFRQHIRRYQPGGSSPWDQNRTDDKIGIVDRFLDIVFIAEARLQLPAIYVIQVFQAVVAHIQHGDLSATSRSNAGSIRSHDARTENGDVGRGHTRNTAHQHASPPLCFLQIGRADLSSHASCHLAHGRQQWQFPICSLHRFVSHSRNTALEQSLDKRAV